MTGKTVVPEEALEAAAEAITARYGDPVRRWKQDVDDAKVALEAAAPFIAAEALEGAAETFSACSPEGEYSSTPEQVIEWLREQAAAVRGEG